MRVNLRRMILLNPNVSSMVSLPSLTSVIYQHIYNEYSQSRPAQLSPGMAFLFIPVKKITKIQTPISTDTHQYSQVDGCKYLPRSAITFHVVKY